MANGDGTTTAAPATLPPPPAPAQTDQTDLPPKVGQSFMERAGGVLSTLMKNRGGDTSALDARLKQHYQQRYDEAKMHQQHYQNYATVLAKIHQSVSTQAPNGIDPLTGKPATPDDIERYTNAYNTEKAAFIKSGGVDKESKGLIQRGMGIVEHAIGRAKQQGQQGQGGLPAPPQPTQAQQPQTQAQSQLPPPPAAMIQQELAEQQDLDKAQKLADINTKSEIQVEQGKPQPFKALAQRVKGSDLPAGVLTMDGKNPDPAADYNLYSTGNPSQPTVATPAGQTAAQVAPLHDAFDQWRSDPQKYVEFQKEMAAAKQKAASSGPAKNASFMSIYAIYRMMDAAYKDNPALLPLIGALAPQVFAKAGMSVPPQFAAVLGQVPIGQPLSPETGEPIGTAMPGAPTGATRNQAQMAARVLPAIPEIRAEIARNAHYLGPIEGRTNMAFLLGKVGSTGDPQKDRQLSELKTNLSMLATAASRFHLNAVKAMDEILALSDAGKDSSEALNGFLDSMSEWAERAQAQEQGHGENGKLPKPPKSKVEDDPLGIRR